MFEVFSADLELVLADFGFQNGLESFAELQRYHYEKGNPNSKEVRLIVKVTSRHGPDLVVRFKNEADVSLDLIESQSQFADLLRRNGILCPIQYPSGGSFAKWHHIHGYDVIVTVEEYVTGELPYVTPELSEQTGRLLAQSHNVAEAHDFHIANDVLFDPFARNDLFSFSDFASITPGLVNGDLELHRYICAKYEEYMAVLSPLRESPRYAVQGDISNCNLFQSPRGVLGMFDFNRSGDNSLYCDAVMQAVFESRLMDYPPFHTKEDELLLLQAFLRGYQSERPFTAEQKFLFPYLYTIIQTFWLMDIRWREDSLLNMSASGNSSAVHRWLEELARRISNLSSGIL